MIISEEWKSKNIPAREVDYIKQQDFQWNKCYLSIISFLIETKIVQCIDGVNQSSDFKLTFCNFLNGYLCYILFPHSLFAICKTTHILKY